MSRSRSVTLVFAAFVTLAACQGHGETTAPISVHPVSPKATGSLAPLSSQAPTTSPAPSVSASPTPTPDTSPSRGVQSVPTPPIFHPSEEPTSVPSGHASPLPLDAFPPDPSPTPTPVGTPTPAPTPVVTPTPGVPASMVVVSNNLDVGSGSIGGVVFGPPDTAGGQPVLVGGGTINIVEKSDSTKRAVLTVGADGTYRLGALALTTYLVWVTRDGYTADTAPTEVTLSIGSNQNSNTPLVLVKTVPFPSP